MKQVKLFRYFSMSKVNLSGRSGPKHSEVENDVSKVTSIVTPQGTKFNWVGPPHPVSNLRMIVYNEPQNESNLERNFRLKRIEVHEWNQQFWEKHNSAFYKCKEEFIQSKKKEIYAIEKKITNKPLSSDEMSKFYKKFLNDKFETHLNYNKEWYKKNIGLLLPAIKVFFYQIWKKRKLQF